MSSLSTRILIAASFAALIAALPASAAETGSVAGSWLGAYDRGGRPVPVMLDIQDAAPGADGGAITFGEPDECALPLSVTAAKGAEASFALGASNGGRCETYALGSLTVTRGDDGKLSFAVATRHQEPGPKGQASLPADAATSAALAGTWTGSYQGRRGPVPMILTLADVKPGETAGTLEFRSPDDCKNPLEFSGVNAAGAYVITPSNSNGGRCQLNVFGTFVLTPTAEGLSAVMRDQRGELRFEATLAK